MSVPRVTCVLVGCAPTQRDPTPVPDVRPAIECLKTGRGVKVNSISICALHSVKIISTVTTVKDLLDTPGQFVNSLLKRLCCATEFPPYTIHYLQRCLCMSELVCLCFAQILMSASPCLPVPMGSAWTRKALTPVRTAPLGTEYHMTGSSVKVSLPNTALVNELLHNTTCILNSAWKNQHRWGQWFLAFIMNLLFFFFFFWL